MPDTRIGASRRGFLRQLVFAQAPAPSKKTLVCIFLRGGADTLNMIVPHGDGEYYRNRPTLAIPAPGKRSDAAIAIDDLYGFHPKLAALEPIFKEGRLGIVQAVGSDNPSGSHFEAQDQLEHGQSFGGSLGGGWLGRHLRSRAGGGDSPLAAVSIGPSIAESLRGAPAATALRSIDELQLPHASANPVAVSRALAKMYQAEVGLISQQGKETLALLDRVERLRNKPYVPSNGAVYPNNPFGQGLREVARIIKASLGLEVACLDLGGWDTHFVQGASTGLQAANMEILAAGLAAFDADLSAQRERVSTLVMTEFGRRLYENGSGGTDHGRGCAYFAMGGGIAGGKVHGAWPGLKEESTLPGPGGLEVKIDYRSVLSEMLVNAVGDAKLDAVFTDFTPAPVGLCRAPRQNSRPVQA